MCHKVHNILGGGQLFQTGFSAADRLMQGLGEGGCFSFFCLKNKQNLCFMLQWKKECQIKIF